MLVADVDITGSGGNNGKLRLQGKFTVYQSLKYRVMLRNRAEVVMSMAMGSPDEGKSMKIMGPATIQADYEFRIP